LRPAGPYPSHSACHVMARTERQGAARGVKSHGSRRRFRHWNVADQTIYGITHHASRMIPRSAPSTPDRPFWKRSSIGPPPMDGWPRPLSSVNSTWSSIRTVRAHLYTELT
jgi:hypothetical protein